MNHATKCKFCSRPLVIQVADDYLGDPFKILNLASCNKCADLRVRRRILEHAISGACNAVQFAPAKDRDRRITEARPLLEALTRKYAVLVAEWHNMSGHLWDDEFVNMLIERPEKIWTILGDYWRMFRQTQKIPA